MMMMMMMIVLLRCFVAQKGKFGRGRDRCTLAAFPAKEGVLNYWPSTKAAADTERISVLRRLPRLGRALVSPYRSRDATVDRRRAHCGIVVVT